MVVFVLYLAAIASGMSFMVWVLRIKKRLIVMRIQMTRVFLTILITITLILFSLD